MDQLFSQKFRISYIIASIIALIVIIFVLARPAKSAEQYEGQFDNVPPNIRQWFKNYNRNGNSCCDMSDCFVLAENHWDIFDGGKRFKVYIKELDLWYNIPESHVILKENPNEGAVACYKIIVSNSTELLELNFYCFTPLILG